MWLTALKLLISFDQALLYHLLDDKHELHALLMGGQDDYKIKVNDREMVPPLATKASMKKAASKDNSGQDNQSQSTSGSELTYY